MPQVRMRALYGTAAGERKRKDTKGAVVALGSTRARVLFGTRCDSRRGRRSSASSRTAATRARTSTGSGSGSTSSRPTTTLEQEIVQEIAAALGRTAAKLDYALLRLELAARDLDAAAGDEVAACAARFDALREEALRARHELLIHREAVGIRRNDVLEQLYPIPPRRR